MVKLYPEGCVRGQQAGDTALWAQPLLAQPADGDAMKILVTGATGLVGSALLPALQAAGHTPIRLIRPGHTAPDAIAGHGFDVQWNPLTGELGGAAVGADAVVNLAGASIAGGRWTEKRKQELRSSRVDSTRALVAALARMASRPRVLVSASAIGWYGEGGEEILTEENPPATDFLGSMASAWEAEARKAEALGIRVVLMRFGIVLAKQGGALPVMARPFRFGVGGRLGSGKQWMSWVALEDAVRILQLGVENEGVRGPVNLVSPQPVRNAEFTATLARVLHRPAVLPAPAFALRLALGKEMADVLLLSSVRVQPAVLERLGFNFQHPALDETLRSLLA